MANKKLTDGGITSLNWPKVTIIITSHNYEPYVSDAIVSVANQTYETFECIIVDDASTDASVSIIEKLLRKMKDGRFSVIKLDRNVGQMGAIAQGLKQAAGHFVALLDADDIWAPSFLLAHISSHLNSNHVTGLSYSDALVIDHNGNVLQGTWMDMHKSRSKTLSGAECKQYVPIDPKQWNENFDPQTDLVEFVSGPWVATWHFSPTSGCVWRTGLLRELVPDELGGSSHIC